MTTIHKFNEDATVEVQISNVKLPYYVRVQIPIGSRTHKSLRELVETVLAGEAPKEFTFQHVRKARRT